MAALYWISQLSDREGFTMKPCIVEVRTRVDNRVWPRTWNQVRNRVWNHVSQIRKQVRIQVWDQIGDQVVVALLEEEVINGRSRQ